MMKRVQLFPITGVLFIMLLGVFGCSKNQDRYEDPPWLGGSNIETLQDAKYGGKYSIFLKLMDKAEYTIPISKQLFTLFVPSDDAFKAYFQSIGISTVDDLTKIQAQQLFTLHMLPNPRSEGEYAALFFRKPTSSTSKPYTETVRYYPDLKDREVLVSSGIKLMPLFSKDYFEDFGGDPNGSDYLFMYPESKWEAGHGDMNWGNAMITESEVRTATGFIYFVDQVVPFQKNIDQYLAENPDKYGIFYDMMQRFAKYAAGSKDEQGLQLYTKSYDLVSNIAQEQGQFTGNENRMLNMFSGFLPPNAVLQKYLDEKVLPTYKVIDSVPKITMYYILQSQIGNGLALLSKFSKNYFNAFGEPTVINKQDISSSHMCSNGVIYEMKRVLEPNVFTCVPGNLFFDANYSTFLNALDQSALLKSLASLDNKITLFAPTNDQLLAMNIRYTVTNGMEYKPAAGAWLKMDANDLNTFVKDHIYDGNITDLSGDEFVKMVSGNYIHYKDGIIDGPLNQFNNDHISIVKKIVPEQNNGTLYNISTPIKSKLVIGAWLVKEPSVSKFKDLIVKAKLIDTRKPDIPAYKEIGYIMNFLLEADFWTGFIPDNDAITAAEAAGLIPTDATALKNFLQYHFVRGSVIFDDGKAKSGDYPSNNLLGTDPITLSKIYAGLNVDSKKNALTITDHSGQVISVDHSQADILVRQGVVHKINKVLIY